MQIFPTALCNITAWRHSRLRAHWLMALVGGGGCGRSMYSAFPGNCSVSYLSFVYGRSLWAGLNGGENSLHWKANMLPLFSIMTLWFCNKVHNIYFQTRHERSAYLRFFCKSPIRRTSRTQRSASQTCRVKMGLLLHTTSQTLILWIIGF